MYRFMTKIFIALLLVVGFTACQKEYSVEGLNSGGGSTSGTAIFTLTGTPNACTGATVGGTYTAGTAADPSNIVTVMVDVLQLGTYVVNTNNSNGLIFSGSGTFTTLGAQPIQLFANGTPTASGSFTYQAGAVSCSFNVTVGGSGGGGSSSGTAVYVFNGNPNACTAPVINGTYQTGTALDPNVNTVVIKANVTTAGTYTITTAANNGITLTASGTFAATGPDQDVTFRASGTPVAAGSTNFATGVATVSCTITIPVTAGPPPPNTSFLKCTIAGVAHEFNASLSATNTPGTPSSLFVGGMETLPVNNGSKVFGLTYGSFTSSTITTGDYSTPTATNTSKFVGFTYNDGAGSTYSVENPPVANSQISTISTINATKVVGTFSGTLTRNSGSGPMTLAVTAGTYDVTF